MDSAYSREVSSTKKNSSITALMNLTRCPRSPNKYTNHIRLPNILHNISMTHRSSSTKEERKFWNPTIISLPSWAMNQYVIISMVHLKNTGYRQNVLCEANICRRNSNHSLNTEEKVCSPGSDGRLPRFGDMVCTSAPVVLEVASTKPKSCEGNFTLLADIPGFHDGRLFYSGRGEPLFMFASQLVELIVVLLHVIII